MVSDLELGEAIEAGRQALVKLLGPGEITFYDTERFAYGASQVFTDAALPHIKRAVIQRLIEKLADKSLESFVSTAEPTTAIGAQILLRRQEWAMDWLRDELEDSLEYYLREEEEEEEEGVRE